MIRRGGEPGSIRLAGLGAQAHQIGDRRLSVQGVNVGPGHHHGVRRLFGKAERPGQQGDRFTLERALPAGTANQVIQILEIRELAQLVCRLE